MKIFKHRRQAGEKTVRLPSSVYLGYLLVCTLLLTSVSFSRYVATSSASDSARAAKGTVTVAYADDTTVELKQPYDLGKEEKNFTFNVSNSVSEVAIRYDVVVKLDEPLPDGITMQLDGTPCSGNSDNTYTFSDMGTFEAGKSETRTHTLSFTGDFTIYSDDGERTYPVAIMIRSRQID